MKLKLIYKGGKGSGNFGHAGIPGQVGGSKGKGSAGSADVGGKAEKVGRITFASVKSKVSSALGNPRKFKTGKREQGYFVDEGNFDDIQGKMTALFGKPRKNLDPGYRGNQVEYEFGNFNISVGRQKSKYANQPDEGVYVVIRNTVRTQQDLARQVRSSNFPELHEW